MERGLAGAEELRGKEKNERHHDVDALHQLGVSISKLGLGDPNPRDSQNDNQPVDLTSHNKACMDWLYAKNLKAKFENCKEECKINGETERYDEKGYRIKLGIRKQKVSETQLNKVVKLNSKLDFIKAKTILMKSISMTDNLETLSDNEIHDLHRNRDIKIETLNSLKELECETSELFARTYQYLDVERRHEVEIALKDVGDLYLQTLTDMKLVKNEVKDRCLLQNDWNDKEEIILPCFSGGLPHVYFFINESVCNLRDKGIRKCHWGTYMRKHLRGDAAQTITTELQWCSYPRFEELCSVLERHFGDPALISRIITDSHQKIGPIPLAEHGWTKIFAVSSNHCGLLQQMSSLENHCNGSITGTYIATIFHLLNHAQQSYLTGECKFFDQCKEDKYAMIKSKYIELKELSSRLRYNEKDGTGLCLEEDVQAKTDQPTLMSLRPSLMSAVEESTSHSKNKDLYITSHAKLRNIKCLICRKAKEISGVNEVLDEHSLNKRGKLMKDACPLLLKLANFGERVRFIKELEICVRCLSRTVSSNHDYMTCRERILECGIKGCRKRLTLCLEHSGENARVLEKTQNIYRKKGIAINFCEDKDDQKCVARRIMFSMGFIPGKGIGKKHQGIIEPVQCTERKPGIQGFGFKEPIERN